MSEPTKAPGIAEILKTESSETFISGMKNRMIVSYHKYGPIADGFPHRVNAIESLKARIARYEETGNTEWLMDVANFAMIEYIHPRHDSHHFRATDSDESPGRVQSSGIVNTAPNLPKDHSIERLKARLAREGD